MKNVGKAGFSGTLGLTGGLQNELYEEPCRDGFMGKIREYVRNHEAGMGNYIRAPALSLYLLGAAGAAAGCNGPLPPTNGCTTTGCPPGQECVKSNGSYMCKIPTPNGKITVSGLITNRIAGGSVSGSRVTYKGPGTQTDTKSADVVNGSYEIKNLTPGNYDVTIEGASHVTHETLVVPASQSATNFPFSVLVWGSSRPGIDGAVYDPTFDLHFNNVARKPGMVQKWDISAVPPTEIYLTEEVVSNSALDELFHLNQDGSYGGILVDINKQNTSDMFCGRVNSLNITRGPPIEGQKNGTIVIRFHDGLSDTLNYPNNNFINSARIRLRTELFNGSDGVNKKRVAAHELYHAAYAGHSSVYPDTLMQDTLLLTDRLSPQDKLASCIVYNSDTTPGNKSPDTNPTYAINVSASANHRR